MFKGKKRHEELMHGQHLILREIVKMREAMTALMAELGCDFNSYMDDIICDRLEEEGLTPPEIQALQEEPVIPVNPPEDDAGESITPKVLRRRFTIPEADLNNIPAQIEWSYQWAIERCPDTSALDDEDDAEYRRLFEVAVRLMREVYERDTPFTFYMNTKNHGAGQIHRLVFGSPMAVHLNMHKTHSSFTSTLLNARAYSTSGHKTVRNSCSDTLRQVIRILKEYRKTFPHQLP